MRAKCLPKLVILTTMMMPHTQRRMRAMELARDLTEPLPQSPNGPCMLCTSW
jgi:hypothetical protein